MIRTCDADHAPGTARRADERPRRPAGHRLPYLVRWIAWILLAGAAATGLTRFRVSNSLQAWSPDRASRAGTALFLTVGFDSRAVDPSRVERTLRALPDVAWCIGPDSTLELAMAGTTPEGLVIGARGDYAGVFCFARPGADDEAFYAQITNALSDLPNTTAATFNYAGPAAYVHALDEASGRRMPLILITITIAGGVLMWALTGSVGVAAASMGAMSLSLVVLLGVACWIGVSIDMSLLLVPPMMISLGYSYAAHASLRRNVSRALAVCGLTTALGVAAFGTTSVPSIRTFAIWGTAGVVLVWLLVVSLVPPAPRSLSGVDDRIDRRLRLGLLRLVRRRRLPLIVGGMAVVALGLAVVPRLVVNPQPLNYFSRSDRLVRDNAILESKLTGMLPFEVVTSDAPDTARILRESPQVRKAIDVTRLSRSGVGHTFWCLTDNDSLDALGGLFNQWTSHAHKRGQTLEVRGVAPQLLEVRSQMRRVAGASIPAMLLVAAAATGILGRSLRAALIGVFVTLIPITGVLVLAGSLGWPMQMPTLMVGAIGIGAGVDDAVHVFWLRRRCSLVRSLRVCLRPCAGSSAIACLCMSAFVISPFRPTAQFGMLMALILALAAIADLVMLPALLLRSHASGRASRAHETWRRGSPRSGGFGKGPA